MLRLFWSLCLAFGIVGCLVTRQDRLEFKNIFHTTSLLAWNEDTVLVCQFSMKDNYRFDYWISSRSQSGKVEAKKYSGLFKLFEERIYLFYDDDQIPRDYETYLLRENRGNYLIQGLKDGRGRVYLRIVTSNSRVW